MICITCIFIIFYKILLLRYSRDEIEFFVINYEHLRSSTDYVHLFKKAFITMISYRTCVLEEILHHTAKNDIIMSGIKFIRLHHLPWRRGLPHVPAERAELNRISSLVSARFLPERNPAAILAIVSNISLRRDPGIALIREIPLTMVTARRAELTRGLITPGFRVRLASRRISGGTKRAKC